jgi:hypothetical protein
MRRRRSICNFALPAILAPVLLSCAVQPRYTDQPAESVAQDALELRLDPLGLPQDTAIVTVPNSAAEKKLLHEIRAAHQAQEQLGPGSSLLLDSLNNQVYRVQLLTVDSYSDARRALAVAEEIFDLPVALTYDQPYYKLRVGEFPAKSEADAYLLKAKSAGYPNAWVLLTNVGVRELRPMYEGNSPAAPPDTLPDSHDKHD